MTSNKPTIKEMKRHKRELDRHVKEFLSLLESHPKPTDEKVRAEFIRHEAEWKLYCCHHSLGTRTSELFNAQMSYKWEQRRVQSNK